MVKDPITWKAIVRKFIPQRNYVGTKSIQLIIEELAIHRSEIMDSLFYDVKNESDSREEVYNHYGVR